MGGGGFIAWNRRPYPEGCGDPVGPLSEPGVKPKGLLEPVRYPRRAWNQDLLALVILGEFGRTDWETEIKVDPPPAMGTRRMRDEIAHLNRVGHELRAARSSEIRDQDVTFHDYFAQLLMISPTSHFETFTLFKMGARVAEMLMVSYKLKYEHPRPQQYFPQLLPILDLPGHSSYPSGHAMIGRMIALCLADVAPAYRDALIALSERIGANREIGGMHFPSDTAAGFSIAEQAHPLLRNCETYRRVRDYASAEWAG